jgi:NAD(P)-dependent dehydrogenase (short-subunit alcohol dehydrogenase family)
MSDSDVNPRFHSGTGADRFAGGGRNDARGSSCVPFDRSQFAGKGMSKVALVTGAGSGIGRAAACALAAHGFRVVVAGRRAEPLEETARLAGAGALAITADVGDADSIGKLFARLLEACGRLDLLFNNAGRGAPAVPFEDLSIADWQAVIQTNLTGAFLCAQAAFRIMKSQTPRGGRIINNGSISAHVPRPNSAPYTASKHGVTGLTRSISLDGRAYDIACGQIDIGNAATAMADRMKAGVLQADLSVKTEPIFDVAHVAQSIVYMASLPLTANVQFLTIMATNMPFIGRG